MYLYYVVIILYHTVIQLWEKLSLNPLAAANVTKNLVTGLDYGEDIATFIEIIENYISKNQVRRLSNI